MSQGSAEGDGPALSAHQVGPGRLPASAGARDLFPLAPVVAPPKPAGGASRRRWRPHRLRCDLVNDAVAGLNWLAGASSRVAGDAPQAVHGDMREATVRRLDGLARFAAQPGRLSLRPPPRQALRGLLRGRSTYGDDTAELSLAPYQQSAVSLPADSDNSPAVVELVGDRCRHLLAGQGERILRPRAEVDELLGGIGSYCDPRLVGNGAKYARFVRSLRGRGLLRFGRWSYEKVGVFFVWKKERKTMRLILDCRRSNAWFNRPPHTALLTAEGLGNLEVDMVDDDATMAEAAELTDVAFSVGIADVKDAFHRLLMPEWMSRYFGLPALTAEEAGLTGEIVDGAPALASDKLIPLARPLPMGFTWSLAICQDCVERLCAEARCLRGVPVLRDRGGPLLLELRGHRAVLKYYVYVDNLGLIGQDGRKLADSLDELIRDFEARGLLAHGREVREDGV